MTLSNLFFLAIVLVCPLSMFFMMRGGHGHSMSGSPQTHDSHTVMDATHDTRMAQLEREVAELRQSKGDSMDHAAIGSNGHVAIPVAAPEKRSDHVG